MTEYLLALPDGDNIPYLLERRSRRTIGMKIGPQGLVVHAPNRISLKQLEAILLSKADWIRSKLESLRQHAVEPLQLEDGSSLFMLGNPLLLNVRHDARSRQPEYQPGQLTIAIPSSDDREAVLKKIVQWYKKQALTDFGRRLEILATKLGVPTPELYLSNARSRWGSCNSKQEIRLNWRLIQAPPHLINYVICHELAHLKEMNHSARFWAIVESICPEYKQAEKDLKHWSPRLHALA